MDVWTDRHTDKQEDIRKFTPVTGVLCPTGHLSFWTVTHVLLLGNLIRSQTSPQRPKISPHSPKSSPLNKISARVIWHTSSLHTNVFESILRQHTGDLVLVTHQMTHFRRPSHHFSSYFMQADRATITPNRRPSHHFSFNQNR